MGAHGQDGGDPTGSRIEPRYFEYAEGGRIRCTLCPHRCVIAPGGCGRCRVRCNRGGEPAIPFAGRVAALAMDPIEKKPLYHYHPGAVILSVGFLGCNFRCPFCQNYAISQSTDVATEELAPEALVALAVERRSLGLAYTYAEPLVHFEFVYECARLARDRGLANVLVSNGFVGKEAAEELLPLLDAANIDLKAWDPEFYRREAGGDLGEVKRFLEQAVGRIHLEVTTLVIPGMNDEPQQIEGIAGFLHSLDPDIPLHLSRYFPAYRCRIPPTRPEALRSLGELARRHLRFVYLGNLGLEEANTLCPSCDAVLIRRRGYQVEASAVSGGRCRRCGAEVPIRGL